MENEFNKAQPKEAQPAKKRETKRTAPKCNVDPTFALEKGAQDTAEYLDTHVIFEYEDNTYATPLGDEIINTMQNPVKKIKKLHVTEFAQIIREVMLANETSAIRMQDKNTAWKIHELSLKDFEFFHEQVGYIFTNGQRDEAKQDRAANYLMNRCKNFVIGGNMRITRFINAPKDFILFNR